MWRTISAVIVGVLILVSCGGDDTSEPATVRPQGEADLAGAYEVAYQICEMIGQGEIDPDPAFAADASNPVAYATEYAADYEPPFRQVYFDGCLDGFEGRPMTPPD